MLHWSLGYNVDVPYIYGAHKKTAPAWLNFVATFDGSSSPKNNWRYLELGCGNGFGLILLAAIYPDHDFVGIDFNPAHISHGRHLAEAAGLRNVRFIEADFVDTARDWPKDWGTFDYVVAHGIVSWIDQTVRHALISTINAAASPGALIYLSYNAMPGQTSTVPIQHLFRLWQTGEAVPSTDAIKHGRKRFQTLMDLGVSMTESLPSIKPRIDDMQNENPHYLIHEFLNDHWNPLWFDEVAREMTRAKAAFVGSAELGDRYPSLVLPPKIMAVLDSSQNPIVREVMLDVVLNRRFRVDIFARGITPLWQGQHKEKLGNTVLCRGALETQNGISFKILLQNVTGKSATFLPLIEKIEDGPKRIADLITPQNTFAETKKLVMYLLQSEVADVCVPIADKEPAKRFNKLVCNLVSEGGPYEHLIATETGTIQKTHYTDMIMLSEVIAHPTALRPSELGQRLVDRHQKRGKPLCKIGTEAIPQEGVLPYAISLADEFLTQRYPHWQKVGVV